jgi:hypothetical protein
VKPGTARDAGRAGLTRSALPNTARQLTVPQGFTLSATGAFAILVEHRPHPGPVAIWLFVTGAALGLAVTVRASGAHRSAAPLRPASGYQLFNLSPVLIVPAISLLVWWIPLAPVAYALAGLSTSSGYLLAVSLLFHAIRPAPR